MPGFNWRFRDKAPFPFKLLIAIVVLNFATDVILIFSLPHWGRFLPDGSHTYPIAVRGKGLYFVGSWVGRFLSLGLWANFVLIVAVVFMVWWYRGQLVRDE